MKRNTGCGHPAQPTLRPATPRRLTIRTTARAPRTRQWLEGLRGRIWLGNRQMSAHGYRRTHATACPPRAAVNDRFDPSLMSRHAAREAARERIPLEMIGSTYEDPDSIRPSTHDQLREIRTRWFRDAAVEVVVDVDDGRVVTVWRKGGRG